MWLAVLAGSSLAIACNRPPAHPPSLLLITLDTTRADVLSAYGNPAPTSPTLELLAREGVRFDAAYAPINFTTPAHATLFTSQSPLEHGVRGNVGEGYPLPAAALTLAERLSDASYVTAGFVGAYTAGLESGLNQGFATFQEPDYEKGAERAGREVVDEALKWLDRLKKDSGPPFFLWVHLFDAHGPYVPPPEYLEPLQGMMPPGVPVEAGSPQAADVLKYEGEIRYADAQVARVIQAARARGPVVIAVLADHGETLTERQCGFYHGHNVFEEQMRVPWLMAGPGIPAGRRVTTPTPTLDVAPTLLGALGFSAPEQFTGRNLMPLLTTAKEPNAEPIWLESGMCEPNRCSDCYPLGVGGKLEGVREGDFKLVRTPTAQGVRLELFHLSEDPGEKLDVSAKFPIVLQHLGSLLDAHFKADRK